MTIGCIAIGYIAMKHLHGQKLNVPKGWNSPFFGIDLNLDWRNILPAAMKKIKDDQFGLFSIFFMMMLFKGVFASLAGRLLIMICKKYCQHVLQKKLQK